MKNNPIFKLTQNSLQKKYVIKSIVNFFKKDIYEENNSLNKNLSILNQSKNYRNFEYILFSNYESEILKISFIIPSSCYQIKRKTS